MAKREIQEINAGSMADIAFLLLIFFLVTTTMDTNQGMMRKLPRLPDPNKPQDEIKVKERNVFVVLINKNDRLFVENKLTNINDLCEKTKEFFTNPNDDPNLSARKDTARNIPYFGPTRISAGVVSVRNDRGTSYDKYIKVQNELLRAINELRDELAKKKFGTSFENLELDKQKAIKKYYPVAISEAEPVQMN